MTDTTPIPTTLAAAFAILDAITLVNRFDESKERRKARAAVDRRRQNLRLVSS